jgi:hypothetical protein
MLQSGNNEAASGRPLLKFRSIRLGVPLAGGLARLLFGGLGFGPLVGFETLAGVLPSDRLHKTSPPKSFGEGS